ncbi:sensor histidine kinase [Streptomyces aureoverticillatus]|uniref:sensor histidine kinase n=1 Tax=Streptomyces aureoverticillatus TaxID=66871 RepID=UPI0013DBE502|nr:sensor domain-containing protein [Streptomyces aureoverticillatus]QIB46158.1 sensor histidine kinase [Streptomyces aureoverticillatus]
MKTSRVRETLVAGARGLYLAIVSLAGSITLFVFAVLSIAFIVLGIGVFTTPWVLTAVRKFADLRRVQADEWADVHIPSPYRKYPADLRSGVTGQVERCSLMLKDPATWRDLQWLLVDMTAGFVVVIFAPALVLYPVYGWVLALGVWKPIYNAGGGEWYGFIHVNSQMAANGAAALGTGLAVLALFANPAIVRGHFLLSRTLLAPTASMRERALTQRVDRLEETRHDAVDTSAAELRRIERDLHDGAQARLVAMGMDLGTIEALVEKDPAKAKEMLAKARQNSGEALTELRDLVRGIHPPVLAERGLGDAVKALALRLPVATDVDVDLAGRADEPVEAAAYFAVSETLTNAVKYAEADRIWVDVHHEHGMLRIAVTDNGKGGAAVGTGSGLSGIERRLGTFDGVLAVSSPVGGPTMVTMEIPCELS